MALMCSASAWSQTWTLSDCIEHALQNNISILKNRVNEESGEATLKQNKSVLWPSLSFSTSHGVNFRPGQVGTTSRPVDGELVTTSNTTANSSYGINMNWTVWNGGINHKNVDFLIIVSLIIFLFFLAKLVFNLNSDILFLF